MRLGESIDDLPHIFHYDVEIADLHHPDKSVAFAIVRQIWDQIRDTNPRLAPFLKVVSILCQSQPDRPRTLDEEALTSCFARYRLRLTG